MPQKVQSIDELAASINRPYTHTCVGQVDQYCAYLSRFDGSYLFHQHTKDELYMVLQGEIYIDYPDGESTRVQENQVLVVKAGQKHRSRAEKESLVLMFKAKDLFAE